MPYSIAILSKYPPLEGGIAAKTYWLSRGLASRGHQVHIITNSADVGGEYLIRAAEKPPDEPPSLLVHRATTDVPWHIPENDEQALVLLDLAIEVIRQYDVQILDSGYLIPYGIVAHLAKRVTGVPHVLRHGGSDIEKFLKRGIMGNLLIETIGNADVIITERRHRDLLWTLNSSIVLQPPYVPNEQVFLPGAQTNPRFKLAAIGKMNYHWRHRRLDYVAEIMGHLADRFECLVIGQGNGLRSFRDSLYERLRRVISFQPFVPPWEMPSTLSQLDAIFVLELDLPHPATSSIALEALCSGVGVITDRPDFAETYRDVVILGEDQVCIIPSCNSAEAAARIAYWIERRSRTQPQRLVAFQNYVKETEDMYTGLLARGSARIPRI